MSVHHAPFSRPDLIRRIEELIRKGLGSEQPEAYERKLREAISLADRLLRADSRDPDAHYLVGYALYHLNSDVEFNRDRSMGHFQKSLEVQPAWAFARLYLGHAYFDAGRYEDALREFQQIPPTRFESIDQHWRALKLRELILCCALYRNPLATNVDQLSRYCDAVLAMRSEAAPPVELMECLRKLLVDPGRRTEIAPLGRLVAVRLQAMPWFDYLHEPLTQLSTAAALVVHQRRGSN